MVRWSRQPNSKPAADPAGTDRVALWRWKARAAARMGRLLPDKAWGHTYEALTDDELRELAEGLLDNPKCGEVAGGVIHALNMATDADRDWRPE